MVAKYNLDNAMLLLNETFRDSHREDIKKLVNNLVDTEDFSEFSKYSKNIVIEYFRAFIFRLACQIWASFATHNSQPDIFFKTMLFMISRHLAKAKLSFLEKNILTDSMSDEVVRSKLEGFFKEYDDRSEFSKAQAEYIDLKQDFNDIEKLTVSLYGSGSELVASSEYLMSHYLKYKAAILKGLGYDVEMEYYSIDNFTFFYRDERLADLAERARIDTIAMNGALKALLPSFTGDISVFSRICAGIK